MCRQFLIKLPNRKFHENSFSGSQIFNVRIDALEDRHGEGDRGIFTTFLCEPDINQYPARNETSVVQLVASNFNIRAIPDGTHERIRPMYGIQFLMRLNRYIEILLSRHTTLTLFYPRSFGFCE
jgi:hypothetical protein